MKEVVKKMPCRKRKGWSYNKSNKRWMKRRKGHKGWAMRKKPP